MKLVRYGKAGKEKPGLIDMDGRIRDLSEVVGDIGGDNNQSFARPRRGRGVVGGGFKHLHLLPGGQQRVEGQDAYAHDGFVFRQVGVQVLVFVFIAARLLLVIGALGLP